MAPGAFFSRFPFRRTSSQDIGDSTSASYGLSTAPPPTSTSRHQLSRAYSQVKSTSSLRRNAARWSVTSSGRQHHHNTNNVTPTQTNERTVDDLFRRPLSHLSTNDTQERRKSVVGKQAITAASSRNSRIPLSPAAGRKPSPLNLTDVKDKLRSLTRQTRSRSRRNSLFDANGTYSAGLPLVHEAAEDEDLLPPRPRSSSPNTSRPRSLAAEPLELLNPLGMQPHDDDGERTQPLLHSNSSRASLYENVGSRPLSLKLESPPPQLDYPYIGGAGLLLDDVDFGPGSSLAKRSEVDEDDASEHEELLPSSPTTPRLHDPSPADDLVPPRRRRRPESPPLSRNVNSWPDSTTSTKSSATLAGSPRDSRRGAPLPPNPFPMEMERMSFPPTASSPTTMSLSSWQGSPCWTPSPPPPPLPHLPPAAAAPAPAPAAAAGSASPSTPSTVKSKATITPAADSTTQAAPALVLMSDVWTRERMAQQENNNSGYIGGEALRRRTSSHHSRSRSRSPSPSPTLASWTRRYYGGLTGSSSSGSGTGGVIGSGSLLSSRTMKKYMTKDALNESGAGRGGGSAGATGQGEGTMACTRPPNGLGKPATSSWTSWRGEDDVLEQRKRGLPPPPRPPRPHDRSQNGSGGSGAKSKQAFALGKGKGKSSSTLSTAFSKGEAARPSSAISAASSAAMRMRRRPGTSGASSDIIYVTTTRDEPARTRSPHPLAQTTTSSSSPLPSSSPPPSSRGSGRGIAPVRAPPPPPTSPAMTLSLPSDTKRDSQRLSAAASSNGSTPPAAASPPSTSLKATTTGGMLSSSSLLMG